MDFLRIVDQVTIGFKELVSPIGTTQIGLGNFCQTVPAHDNVLLHRLCFYVANCWPRSLSALEVPTPSS